MAAGRRKTEATPDELHLLAAWAEHDAARALHPLDHETIRATESARSLILDLLRGGHARDLFNACARLGALMAEAGASPSLAAGAIDSALRALGELNIPHDASRVAAARASLVEGYVAAIRDAERAAAEGAWEHPACVVPLDPSSVAIACGHPSVDREVLEPWAARIAGRLVKAKVRIAFLEGRPEAKGELASALELVGIRVTQTGETVPTPAPETKRHWLRLPWTK